MFKLFLWVFLNANLMGKTYFNRVEINRIKAMTSTSRPTLPVTALFTGMPSRWPRFSSLPCFVVMIALPEQTAGVQGLIPHN